MAFLDLLTGYAHYWLHAVNEHSLQAPFVYQLYQEVIKSDQSLPVFEDIEQRRRVLLASPEEVITPTLGAPSRVSKASTRTIGHIARHSLSPPKFGRLLFRLASFQSARYVVELGTSLGITTLYLSAVPSVQQIFTLEGSSEMTAVALQQFRTWSRPNIQLVTGNIDDTLAAVLGQMPQLDVAYLDANHRYEPTMRYFAQLLTKVHEDSVILVDDIYWSREMKQAWKAIKNHPSVTLSIDIFEAGLVFFRPLRAKQDYVLSF